MSAGSGKVNLYMAVKSTSFRHYLLLTVIIFCSFLPVLEADFLNWDDDVHIYNNAAVLSFDVRGMFTQVATDAYIPLTSLSFAIEKAVFGLNPRVFHLDNLFLHIAVAGLLMGLFLRLGAPLRAAFCGALFFAVHPMRVESVAWVTERKDVLYAFFYVLALRQWLCYLDARKFRDLGLTLVWGALSLLAKPMAVSLPLVMIFMEWWRSSRPVRWIPYVPVVVMAAGIGVLTYVHHARIIAGDGGLNVLLWVWTLGFYILKTFLPQMPCPLYELPSSGIAGPVYLASVIFVGLVMWILKRTAAKQRDRWLLWAAGFLFLSIFFLLRFDVYDRNIVADRFMYLPGTGICIWLGVKADQAMTRYGRAAMAVIVGVFLFLIISTFRYSLVWKDSATFWTYMINSCSQDEGMPRKSLAVQDTGGSINGHKPDLIGSSTKILALFNRGVYYKERAQEKLKQRLYQEAGGLYQQAFADFDQAIRLDPQFSVIYNSRALVRHYFQDETGALEDFTRAIEKDPAFQEAYVNRCSQYGVMDQLDLALADCQRAIELGPDMPELYNNIGMIYAQKGLLDLSLKNFDKALALDPHYEVADSNRSVILQELKDVKKK
ncbi:MAG: hypothetical protein A2Z88_04805 [Omnitrophica WOR_2 bacterium GWA2_47_8]|nr:MAG: hypothetical protein A2Z88_04805 [Omnitrophica WOR_2 bacterium GWA2_47_8]